MGATLAPPAMAVLGFLLLTGLVVVLGASSTARYEFERNGARDQRRADARTSGSHPAGRRGAAAPAGAAEAQPRSGSVDVAERTGPASGGKGWWLIDDRAQVLAGPFADRIDADWAALADELPAVSVHGVRRPDGSVALRPSPEERAWLGELSEQLDRLPRDWDDLLSDTDPLTTLVVEVAAALVEAGMPLHDLTQAGGGVCLVPDLELSGVVVSWRAHDRLSLQHQRGPAADATVQRSMNAAIAEVLANLGFVVEPAGATGSSLVTALT
ncbi:hypothetical protein [Blastococcus tunisiensis]|nr:hypothetical protein [Blastococcus sp. DSM 46838]